MSAEDDLPDIDTDVDELEWREGAYFAAQRAARLARRDPGQIGNILPRIFDVPGPRDELDDRTGFTRPPNLSRGWWFSRVLKERHPLWLPFRFLTQLQPQQTITDSARSDTDATRYTGYVCFIWDYESEIQRMFRITRTQMQSLLNLGLTHIHQTDRFKWLAHWEEASDRRFGSALFRLADEQDQTRNVYDGIPNAAQVIAECNRRLNEMPAIVDRRRNPPPENTPEPRWGDPINLTGRQIRDSAGNVIGESFRQLDPEEDQALVEMLRSIQDRDNVQFGSDISHSGDMDRPHPGDINGQRPRRRPRQLRDAPQIQPPPGQIGGRKLDLS